MPARSPAMLTISRIGLRIRDTRVKTGRRKLRLVGKLSRWMEDQRLDLPALDETQLERFRASQSRLGKYTANVIFDGRELLTWLYETERLAPTEPEPSHK